MTAVEFKPKFRNDVTVTVPGASVASSVNQKQCLTEESAAELSEILAAEGPAVKSKIVYGHPMGVGGGAEASAEVPYLLFEDGPVQDQSVADAFEKANRIPAGKWTGTIINAGLLADYWVRNPPQPDQKHNVALRNATKEYETEKKNQGFGV